MADLLTSVLSTRCTPEYLAEIDSLAQSHHMKRGQLLIHALDTFRNGGTPAKSQEPTKDNILKALLTLGPSTCPEIGDYLGCSRNQVSRRMRDLWIMGKVHPQGDKESPYKAGCRVAIWHHGEVER